jgi:excinuclease ABC subunit C
MANELKEKVSRLPEAPGVYFFKDAAGRIMYIGKATSLKKRVQSYFVRELSARTQVMVAKIVDLDYRLAPSESQAQILEAALIKQHQPYYNVSLKDDKSFPLIRITDETFPLVSLFRRKRALAQDTAVYFGPYTDAKLLKQALTTIRRIFGFRSCKTMPQRACLYGRINLCPAPCEGKITPLEYRAVINNIAMLLDSKYSDLLDTLTQQMKDSSARHDFEEAARLRDQIAALSVITNTTGARSAFDESEDLQQLLALGRVPERIEGFDISNISGHLACGSMVSFYKGLPDKNNYRRYRIKTVSGIDDYTMIAEVVRRRYIRLKRKNLPLPDVILIDGGKSHVQTAARELEALGLRIPLIGIAKDRENIYIYGSPGAVHFQTDTLALNLIRRVRDEAHRFALSYHRLLRRKKSLG